MGIMAAAPQPLMVCSWGLPRQPKGLRPVLLHLCCIWLP